MTGDLHGRFSRLVARLGAPGNPDEVEAALLAAWAEPHRAYHGTAHLRDCLRQLDGAPDDGADRRLVEAALWFHDAVYDPRCHDNESRSGHWAESALRAMGASQAVASEVRRLVLLTAHDQPASDPSGELLCDVDLSILGRAPPEYDAFERAIRAEYAWVPEEVYRRERGRLLTRLLDRVPLYRTGHFRALYESGARSNLRRALTALHGS